MTKNIAVIGGGAWGTALAANLARAGHSPLLWARDHDVVETIRLDHMNRKFLDGILLPETICPTTLKTDIAHSDVILVSIPTQAMRAVLTEFANVIGRGAMLVLCAKGIEASTGLRVSDIARSVLPDNRLAVLSGPSFAHDVARGLPTAVTLAAASLEEAQDLARIISSPTFRPYASDDMKGVELGGALKNVIALAVGMARGRALGASAEAALITRGFAELTRIARHFGGKAESLTGLSGLGDLVLTCSSAQSRNFAYGMAVGAGQNLDGLKLAEGVYTCAIAHDLCARAAIEAPIITAVDGVLSKKLDMEEAMAALLARPLKAEMAL